MNVNIPHTAETKYKNVENLWIYMLSSEMALTPEKLKELRMKNLNRKGRQPGSKNKVTEKKLVHMIEIFMRNRKQEKTDIVEKVKELKIKKIDVLPQQEENLDKLNIKEIDTSTKTLEKEKPETKENDWIDDLFT
jgi:hypothetical protein